MCIGYLYYLSKILKVLLYIVGECLVLKVDGLVIDNFWMFLVCEFGGKGFVDDCVDSLCLFV